MRRVTSLAVLLTVCAAYPDVFPARADEVTIGALKDNTLYEDEGGGLSNGMGAHFFAGMTFQPAIRRGLIAFDIAAAVPAGSTINSVTLTLNMSRTIAGDFPVSLHRALADWGEGASDAFGGEGAGDQAEPGDATWLHTFFPDEFWATAGGDFDPDPSATTVVGGIGFYTWGSTPEMVTDVQQWLDNPGTNFGWVVICDETSIPTAKRFDSRQNPTSGNRPKLTIDFTPSTGGPVCPDDFTINRGIVSGGEFQNICDSDNADWSFQPDAIAATVVAPINVELRGDAGDTSADVLRFLIETAATHSGVVLRVEIFNFITGAFEGQVFPNIPTSDTDFMIERTTNASDFISDSGEVRSRVSYLRPAGVPPFWMIHIDRAVWEIE